MRIGLFGSAVVLVNKISKNTTTKLNRVVEKKVTYFNPTIGKSLRKFNETTENIHDTIDNFFDANDPVSLTIRNVSAGAKEFSLADHLYVQRFGYTHHGLYIGNNTVIHYLMEEGITFNTLEEFAKGAKIHRKNSPKKFSDAEIIVRAHSRVRENSYNLFRNNCENFVVWCRSGR